MGAKGLAFAMLMVVLAVAAGGCITGSGLEAGVYGSSRDLDDLGDGYGGGGKLELNIFDVVSVDGRAGWIRFDDTEIDMVPLEIAALVNAPVLFESIVPYVGGGVGYYMFEGDGGDLDDNEGWFATAGLEAGLPNISIFGEVRWQYLEADVTDGEGSLAGVGTADLDGPGINVGLLIRF
jgi:hypothetical protein